MYARTVLVVPTQSGLCERCAVIELQGEVRCVEDAEEYKVIGCSVFFCHATMSAWFINYNSSEYNSFEISVSFGHCEGTMRVTKLPKEKEERLSATAKTFVLDEAGFAVDSALENFSSLWVFLTGNFWKSACSHITSTHQCQTLGNFVAQTGQEAVSSIAKAINESWDKNESFGLLLNRIGEFHYIRSGNILLNKLLEVCQMSMYKSRYERSLGSSEMVVYNPFRQRAQMSTKHSPSRESLLSFESDYGSGSDQGSFLNMKGTECFLLPEKTLLLDPVPILTRSLPTPQQDLSYESSHSSLVDPSSRSEQIVGGKKKLQANEFWMEQDENVRQEDSALNSRLKQYEKIKQEQEFWMEQDENVRQENSALNAWWKQYEKVKQEQGHESVLLDKCFIPFGIKTVQINQSGGVYCLEPTTDGVEDHSDDSEQQRTDDVDDEGTGTPRKSRDIGVGREEENRFKIEVPDGALEQEFLEVRSAIIFSGPWRLPEGYILASPVLYISFDWSAVTKPITVRVPHWIAQVKSLSAEDCPLVIAPHELPEDDSSKYTFSFLDQESCSVGAQYSTIKLSGHCCLLTQLAIKERFESKGQVRYSATAWTKPRDRQSGFMFRVPVIFDLPSWYDVLEEYLNKLHKWTRHEVLPIDFKFKAEAPNEASLSGTLTEDSGPGWTASLNREKLPQYCVEFELEEQSLERKLKWDAYPPSFTITVNYEFNDREQYTQSGSKTKNKQVNLVVSGNDSDSIRFPFEVEEAVHQSETGSLPSLRSPSTASRNGSTKEVPTAPMARMEGKIDSSFDIFGVEEYNKGLIGDMAILGAVLGIAAEAEAIMSSYSKPNSQLLKILDVYIARASPTWGDFCTALKKYYGFNNVREKIQGDHN